MPDAVLPAHFVPTAPTVFQYPEGWLEFVPVAGGFRVSLRPHQPGGFVALQDVVTWFPPDVVRGIAASHGFAWTAEVIARHQDPYYLERILKHQLYSYFPALCFRRQARLGLRLWHGRLDLLPGSLTAGQPRDGR